MKQAIDKLPPPQPKVKAIISKAAFGRKHVKVFIGSRYLGMTSGRVKVFAVSFGTESLSKSSPIYKIEVTDDKMPQVHFWVDSVCGYSQRKVIRR